jgi:PiT family inorganic phosphate transporter
LILSDVLLLAVAFIFGANNLGVVRSAFRQFSGWASFGYAGAASLAFAAGYLLEGHKVSSTLTTSLTSVNGEAPTAALIAILVLMGTFTLLKFPASVSNVLLGSMVGISLAANVPISLGVLSSVLAAWLLSPLSAAGMAILIQWVVLSVQARRSLVAVARWSRMLGLASVVIAGYTLGANNLGALLGFSSGPTLSVMVLIAAIIGGLAFSGSVAWLLGWKMAVLSPSAYLSALLGASLTLWLYTQLGIPTSLTQAIVGAMVVLSSSRKPSMVDSRVVFEVLGSWPILLLSSMGVAFLASVLL